MNHKDNRILGLDIVRVISMFMIIMYHYTCRYAEKFEVENFCNIRVWWGYLAVNTFFVLTSFLTISRFPKNSEIFLKKRLLRLYPTYLVCVLITWGTCSLLMPELSVGVKDLLLNLTLFPGLFGASYVDGAYWTLTSEITFCFLCFGVAKIVKKESWKIVFLYLWMGSVFVLNVVQSIIDIPYLYTIAENVLLIHSRSSAFGAGIIVALLFERKPLKQLLPAILLVSVNSIVEIGKMGVCWIFVSAILIYLIVCRNKLIFIKKNTIVHKIFTWLSGVSYSVYLLHQNIGYCIITRMDKYSAFLRIVIPISCVLILSTFIHYLFEKPITKILFRHLD